MPHPVVKVGAPITPIDVATPFTTPGVGTLFLDRFTPGYIIGGRGKKQQQVGALAEDPLRTGPIEIPAPVQVTVALVEKTATDPQDPKVGRRHYVLNVHDGDDDSGALLHQEEFFFDDTLSTTTFSGSSIVGAGSISGTAVFTPYSAFAPGDQFQKGSVRQPALSLQGFFAAGV